MEHWRRGTTANKPDSNIATRARSACLIGLSLLIVLGTTVSGGVTAFGPTSTAAAPVGADSDRPLKQDANTTDSDGDGLSDDREALLGTDPNQADTDGDGLTDSRELELNTDPLKKDTDGDGIPDGVEADGPTNPTLADTDNDGLNDSQELQLGTNATNKDTDGDGIPDGLEWNESYLPDADPLRYDIFIELDYTPGNALSETQQQRLIDAFAEAPIKNPDGTTGISLHITLSTQVPSQQKFNFANLRTYHQQYFNHTCGGYQYGVLADNPVRGDQVGGFALRPADILVAVPQPAVIMHELGHTRKIVGPGVDSEAVSFEDYPSVMNYNSPPDYLGYSSGGHSDQDNNDWRQVATNGNRVSLSTKSYTLELYPKPDECPSA